MPSPVPTKVAAPHTEHDAVSFSDVAKLADVECDCAVLIDVRSQAERKSDGKISHAKHVPIDEIESAFYLEDEDFEAEYGFKKPTKNTPVVFHCFAGNRAAMARDILKKLGYTHVKMYKGGIQEWNMPPLLRLRKRVMTPFGKAVGKDNDNSTAVENGPAIALGKVDPVEKAAVDEVTTLMQSSQQMNVVSQTEKRLSSKAAEEAKAKAAAAQAEAAKAAAAAVASPQVDENGEKKALSWAEAKKAREALAAQAGQGGRQGRDTGAADGKATRRTASGKIVDPLVVRVRNLCDVTTDELQRLFGPDNGLGRIARMFISGGKDMAYISYKSEADAAKAIQTMNKRKFKHLILSVDHGTKKGK